MKKTVLFLTFLFCTAVLTANPVTDSVAHRAATNFFRHYVLHDSLIEVTPKTLEGSLHVFVPVSGRGYVVTSSDDAVPPIIGYSVDGIFPRTQMPLHVAAWFEDLVSAVNYIRDSASEPGSAREWSNLLSGNLAKDAQDSISVPPLVTTKWAQTTYYNALCPTDTSGGHALVGCGAVAMGQIMKYWNFPESGHGSRTYKPEQFDTLSVCFDSSSYNWSLMPDSLNAYSADSQIYAVAHLLYDIGVSLEMDYGMAASSSIAQSLGDITTPCVENAFRNVFGYSQSVRSYDCELVSDDRWSSVVDTELYAGRPVLYTGSGLGIGGHAFVVDGIDSNHYYHANFGWGGQYDGYFNVFFSVDWHYFTYYRTAFVGIKPASQVPDSVTILALSSDSVMGSVSGTGVYAAVVDTVSLLATANEGYRFVYWSDGCRYNPRVFIPNEDCLYTAIFSDLDNGSKRLSYVDNEYHGAYVTTDDTLHVGVRYPAGSFPGGCYLDCIYLGVHQRDNYTIIIYQGGDTVPEMEVYRETVELSPNTIGHDLKSINISRPFMLDSSRSLWITILVDSTDNEMKLITTSYYSGNSQGMLIHDENGWHSLNDEGSFYSWAIQMRYSVLAPYRYVYAKLDVPNAGYIKFNGMTATSHSYHVGATVRLEVFCTSTDSATGFPYRFVSWSDGSVENPYSFVVEGTTSLVAHVEPAEPEDILEVDADGVKVWVDAGLIMVDCKMAERANVSIYDVNGRLLFSEQTDAVRFRPPSSGVYVVRVGSRSGRKVVVLH